MGDAGAPQGLEALPQRGLSAEAARQLSGWAWFAVLSLAIAGAFALLLALSRTPGIGTLPFWPIGFFQKGLVIHVVFSFVLWFLAVFGALMHLATEALDGDPRLAWFGRVALWAIAAAMPLLFVPGFLDRGEASLNNYVPAIVDPLYYSGLIALAVGGTAAALRLILALHGRIGHQPADVTAVAAAAIIFLVALMCFVLALVALGDTPPSPAFNEVLFWGGGHVLQFVNTLLLMVSWHLLSRNLAGSPASSPLTLKLGAWWLLLIALVTPFLYAGETGIKEARTSTFTDLQYVFAPPSARAWLPPGAIPPPFACCSRPWCSASAVFSASSSTAPIRARRPTTTAWWPASPLPSWACSMACSCRCSAGAWLSRARTGSRSGCSPSARAPPPWACSWPAAKGRHARWPVPIKRCAPRPSMSASASTASAPPSQWSAV
jgi:hypothetical protein